MSKYMNIFEKESKFRNAVSLKDKFLDIFIFII